MTTYKDLCDSYGVNNVRQLGNKVIVICTTYGTVTGYTIDNYQGFNPYQLTRAGYTDISNTGYNWDKAYDLLFGAPTTAPDFAKAVK